MEQDEDWRRAVRAELMSPEGHPVGAAPPSPAAPTAAAAHLAASVIALGNRRLAARARQRTATVGFALAYAVLIVVYAWAEAETAHTAEVTLGDGAPWTP